MWHSRCAYLLAALLALLASYPYLQEVVAGRVALGVVNVGVIVAETVRLARVINDALDIVATAIALNPMGNDSTTNEPDKQAA